MPLPSDHLARVERALLSLEGLAIGDALGEMLSSNCSLARTRVEGGLMAGPWFHTDDTEMALSVVEVLRKHGRIEPNELALRFAERFRRDPDRGYGHMARAILRGILKGEGWEMASASAFSGMGSMGNGGAMRVAPLGAYFAEDLDSTLRAEAILSASVTHAHREGKAGAVAVAAAAATAWKLRGESRETAGPALMQEAFRLTPEGETRDGIGRAMRLAFFTSPTLAAKILGNGSAVTAPDTVPYCLWSAARHLDDYKEALVNTISGDGDCDTNAAIVGGIVALHVGMEGIPAEWRVARERFDFE